MHVEGLLEKLETGDWFAQGDAARILGKSRDVRGVPPLIRALESSIDLHDSSVGVCLTEALGKIGDPAAVPALCRALEEGTPWVRAEAARALGRVGSSDAIEPLCRALTDEETLVIWRAAEALGELGPAAVGPICRVLEAVLVEPTSSQHGAIMTSGRAAQTLGRLGLAEAVPMLCAMLGHSDEWVVGCAAEALGKVGDPAAVEPLVPLLEGRSPQLRAAAAIALGRLRELRALTVLIELLGHSQRELRLAAAEALELLGNPGALGPIRRRLLPLIGERDAEVAAALRKAVARLESLPPTVGSRPIPANPTATLAASLPCPARTGADRDDLPRPAERLD